MSERDSETGHSQSQAKAGTFGGLSPAEAASRSAASRRAKKEQREEAATENALTARQRLGVSLSKLTQAQWDEKVKAAKATELVRFLDQAFGRPSEAEDDAPKDEGLAQLTKDQRATLRAMLLEDEAAEGQEHSEPGSEAEPDST